MSSFGLMLHHFYDDNLHPQGQGAISRNEFESLLNYLETNHNVHGCININRENHNKA